MKVVFITGSTAQVQTFDLISRELMTRDKSCQVMALAMQGYKPESLTDLLRKLNIPFRDIADYNGENVVEILRAEEPDIVVLGNDSTIVDRAFVEAARFLDIPTLLIQDGIIGKAPFSLNNLQRLPNYARKLKLFLKHYVLLLAALWEIHHSVFRPVLFVIKDIVKKLSHSNIYGTGSCTKMAVFGDCARQILVDREVPEERIVVTGQPRLDAICEIGGTSGRKYIAKILGVDEDTKIILLLTQSLVEDGAWREKRRDYFWSVLLDATRHATDCVPVVKVHPRENPEAYQKLLKRLSLEGILVLQNEISLYELLNSCDVAVSIFSTTLLEAMAFDKPVIIANLFREPDHVGYISSGAALCVEKAEDLVPAIRSALYDEAVRDRLAKNRKRFVYDNAYLIDGQASGRVAEVILEMIEESRKAKIET